MKENRLLKISAVALLILVSAFSLKAQQEYDHVFNGESFTVAETLNVGESYHYKATKSIELKPGFSYTAAEGKMARFQVSKDFSVDDNALNDIALYPNPAGDKIRFSIEKDATIRITNVQGVVLIEENISVGDNEIDISNLSNGVYVYLIDGITRGKFVKF